MKNEGILTEHQNTYSIVYPEDETHQAKKEVYHKALVREALKAHEIDSLDSLQTKPWIWIMMNLSPFATFLWQWDADMADGMWVKL